jgi:hypothetical protein
VIAIAKAVAISVGTMLGGLCGSTYVFARQMQATAIAKHTSNLV